MADTNIVYGGPININENDRLCKSLGELFLNRLQALNDKIVLIDGTTGEHITAAQLRHRSIRFARSLQHEGIEKGDTLFICSEDRMEFAYALIGSIYLGAHVASVESHFLPNQIGHMIDETKPKLIFCSSNSIATIKQLAYERSFIKKIILLADRSDDSCIQTCHEFVNRSDMYENDQSLDFQCDAVDMHETIALVLRTSGTTGFPKGILVTQQNLFLACTQFIKHDNIPEPIVYSVISWVRGIGVKILLRTILNGETLVFLYPQKDRLWRTIEMYAVNILIIHPELMKVFSQQTIQEQYDFSNLKLIICGGSPLSVDVEQEIRKHLPDLSIRRTYGMVELSYITEEHTDVHKCGSVGRLLPGVWSKVVNVDNGETLATAHELGELCFKGDVIMKGYLHIDQPKQRIDSAGWFHSGDVGHFDEDGDLFLVGRIDDMILCDGKKISPFHIEKILSQLSGVRECGVIGVPDAKRGEIPAAVVVQRRAESITIDEITQVVFDETGIELSKVLFVKKLPRSIIGKLMRSYLKIYCSENPAGDKNSTTPFYLRWYENHKI